MIFGLLAAIVFGQTIHNFGNVDCSVESVSCGFTLTNDTSESINIEDVIATCPCLTVSWDKRSIDSGKSSDINVVYHVERGFKHFDKTFIVKFSNGIEPVTCRVLGNLVQTETSLRTEYPCFICNNKVGLNTRELTLGQICHGKSHTSTVSLANFSNEKLSLELRSTAGIGITPSSLAIGPLSTGQIELQYTPDNTEYGKFELPLIIETNDSSSDSVTVSAVVVDDFSSYSQAEINAGPYPRFELSSYFFSLPYNSMSYSTSISFKNVSDSTLHVRNVFLDNVDVNAEIPESVSAGGVGIIKLNFNTHSVGSNNITTNLYMITDSPLKPVSQIRIEAIRERSYYDPSSKLK